MMRFRGQSTPLTVLVLMVSLLTAAPARAGDIMVGGHPGGLVASGGDGVGGIERKRPGNPPATPPGKSSPPFAPPPGFIVPPPPPPGNDATIEDLGGGLTGSHGAPRLGPVLDPVGGRTGVAVIDGPSMGRGWLVIGSSEAQVPFRGGTLVPSPDIVLAGVALDDHGAAFLETALPPGVTVVVQVWLVEPTSGTPCATNGLLLKGT